MPHMRDCWACAVSGMRGLWGQASGGQWACGALASSGGIAARFGYPALASTPTIAAVPNLVDILSLDFAYGQQLVLKHIDLPVESGTTLGVIGPNGGGKTTLLRLLLNLHQPTRGGIKIDGLSPAQAVQRGDVVGYLPQNYAL